MMPDREEYLSLLLPMDLTLSAYSIFKENSPRTIMYLIVISNTKIKISGIKNNLKVRLQTMITEPFAKTLRGGSVVACFVR
jgi:hypothetical protein